MTSIINEMDALTLKSMDMQILSALETNDPLYMPLVMELKQQLDKESGEVVIILDENAVPSVDTRVIINISTSKHNACKALLDQTSACLLYTSDFSTCGCLLHKVDLIW